MHNKSHNYIELKIYLYIILLYDINFIYWLLVYVLTSQKLYVKSIALLAYSDINTDLFYRHYYSVIAYDSLFSSEINSQQE